MRKMLMAAATSAALAGIGHNLPPVAIVPESVSEKIRHEHNTKRRENKKLWQRRRRKPKQIDRYHSATWSQRKRRLFKGHRI